MTYAISMQELVNSTCDELPPKPFLQALSGDTMLGVAVRKANGMNNRVDLPPWVFSREEVLKWRDDYNAHEDSFNRGLEDCLRRIFRAQKFVTHNDMRELLKWKFAEMPGRLKRELNLLSAVSPDLVKDATSQAFALADDVERLRQLRRVKGVGVAVASVILSFYDPENFGVIDIHSWRELFGKEQNSSFQESDFLRFTQAVRELALLHSLPARDVEKALFRKNRV